MHAYHDHVLSGDHLASRPTYEKIRQTYWWPTMNRDVRTWCQESQACQRRKTAHNRNKLPTGHVPVQRAFERIWVDLVEYKVESVSAAGVRCKYVLSMMDHLTRFTVLTPIPNKSAVTVAVWKQCSWQHCYLSYNWRITHHLAPRWMRLLSFSCLVGSHVYQLILFLVSLTLRQLLIPRTFLKQRSKIYSLLSSWRAKIYLNAHTNKLRRTPSCVLYLCKNLVNLYLCTDPVSYTHLTLPTKA